MQLSIIVPCTYVTSLVKLYTPNHNLLVSPRIQVILWNKVRYHPSVMSHLLARMQLKVAKKGRDTCFNRESSPVDSKDEDTRSKKVPRPLFNKF